MNIYDFDNTIYDGDSCRDIVIFGLKKYPRIVLKSLLNANRANKLYKDNKVEFESVKEALLSFIFEIDNYEEFIDEFVKTHMKKIKPWYISYKREDDVIASASYELWVSKFMNNLGIKNVIATKVDENGKIIGKNCKREEKVRRIKEEYKKCTFENAYSDSEVDSVVLELANNPYVVEGNDIIHYVKEYKFKNKR